MRDDSQPESKPQQNDMARIRMGAVLFALLPIWLTFLVRVIAAFYIVRAIAHAPHHW